MKSKVKILMMLCLAAVFTVMMATPAFAITKADNAGKGKVASEIMFGDSLMGERLPVGGALIDEDSVISTAHFPPDDVNNPNEDNENPPGGSEGRKPPTVEVPGRTGQPGTTTTTETPPPSTNTSTGKLGVSRYIVRYISEVFFSSFTTSRAMSSRSEPPE